MWAGAMAEDIAARAILVAEDDGEIIGFAVAGSGVHGEEAGELYAINVDPGRWGAGVGGALLRAAEEAVSALGHEEAVLWVLPINDRARRFYESAGWQTDGAQRTAVVLGVEVPEIRYRRRLAEEL